MISEIPTAQPAQSPIPKDVLKEIEVSPGYGNIYPVSENGSVFGGRILKADVISFASSSRLDLTGFNEPYIAIVAKRIQFNAPTERATITVVLPRLTAKPPSQHPHLGKARTGNTGGSTKAGEQGDDGNDGTTGNSALAGDPTPTLYIIAGEVISQPGNKPPDFIDLTIVTRGMNGAKGGDGQDGQDGGDGGTGGPADWNGISCDGGAGDGGPGGMGGVGGKGGAGGYGANGGYIYLGGTKAAIKILSFCKPDLSPGSGGLGGNPGKNGRSGEGGARGERRGDCDGGEPGKPGLQNPRLAEPGLRARDGVEGKVYSDDSVDVEALF